jgi:hypothetical protein
VITRLHEIIVAGEALKNRIAFLFLAPLLAVTLGACVNMPAIMKSLSDLRVRAFSTYRPSAEVAQLVSAATMTDAAREIFYSAEPLIDVDRAAFEQHCHAPVPSNAVELGCYTSQNRIYILNINQPRLSGEMVVVAAHEMLHAAYAGLSREEMDVLTPQLENAVAQIHSAELTQRLRAYRASEPRERENELHSIIGTEFTPLAAELERYYSQYFADRSVVVADEQQFQEVFSAIQASLNSLRAQIDRIRSDMDTAKRQKRIPAYNALVPRLNNLVNEYNQTVAQYNALSRSLVGTESTEATQ